MRTLAYVANRPDWLARPGALAGHAPAALEDRLSDTLHEKLMARFVDRRTSALMRGLRVREDMLAGVGADGAVTVEGHFVGRLTGVALRAGAAAPSALEDKALRAAAPSAPSARRSPGGWASWPPSRTRPSR